MQQQLWVQSGWRGMCFTNYSVSYQMGHFALFTCTALLRMRIILLGWQSWGGFMKIFLMNLRTGFKLCTSSTLGFVPGLSWLLLAGFSWVEGKSVIVFLTEMFRGVFYFTTYVKHQMKLYGYKMQLRTVTAFLPIFSSM